MVAQTISLPNIRKLFIPDPGYMIAEGDLAGADAQVVAWEANDTDLKTAFRKGWKIHAHNSIAIWGKERAGEDGRKEPYYTNTKKAVHATNYLIHYISLAQALRWPEPVAKDFQRTWLRLHPGISIWHDRIERDLFHTRTVKNQFGFQRYYFDRVESVLKEAVAWIPQSTVAVTINKGILNVYQDKELRRAVKGLLQVHDSFVFQYPKSDHPHILDKIKDRMTIEIPYEDPLVIPIDIKHSSRSWGHCK